MAGIATWILRDVHAFPTSANHSCAVRSPGCICHIWEPCRTVNICGISYAEKSRKARKSEEKKRFESFLRVPNGCSKIPSGMRMSSTAGTIGVYSIDSRSWFNFRQQDPETLTGFFLSKQRISGSLRASRRTESAPLARWRERSANRIAQTARSDSPSWAIKESWRRDQWPNTAGLQPTQCPRSRWPRSRSRRRSYPCMSSVYSSSAWPGRAICTGPIVNHTSFLFLQNLSNHNARSRLKQMETDGISGSSWISCSSWSHWEPLHRRPDLRMGNFFCEACSTSHPSY